MELQKCRPLIINSAWGLEMTGECWALSNDYERQISWRGGGGMERHSTPEEQHMQRHRKDQKCSIYEMASVLV